MAMNPFDATIVNICFPAISATFPHASTGTLAWILNAYNLVFGALLIAGGQLADVMGRRRVFVVGVALFTVASALCATAGSVVLASIINGIGASFFFPANSSAVMKAAPPEAFGIASGMLRTFANIGMVFSFAVAILIASRSISRGLAFAIFVGSTSLHGAVAVAFTSGLHAAFYASMGFMALAAALSALRAGSYPETRV